MKRALSFILALTLALTLLPTFAAAETTETMDWSQPIVFDFGSPTNPTEVTHNAVLANGGTYEGDDWKFVLSNGRSKVLNGNEKVKTFNNTNGKYVWIGSSASMVKGGNNTFAIAVDVPASGIYDISANVFNTKSGAKIVAAIQDQPSGTLNLETAIGEIENTYTSNDDSDQSGEIERVFSEGVGVAVAKTENFATAGHPAWIDNLIVLSINQDAGYNCYLYNFKFTPSTINSAAVTVDTATEYEVGDTITPSVTLNIEGLAEAKTYSGLDMAGIVLGVADGDHGITVANNVFTVAKAGEITFTPTVTVNGTTHDAAPVTITVAEEPEEDPDLTNAFTVVETPDYGYIAPTAIGVMSDGTTIDAEPDEDGGYNLTAPDTNAKSESFLYWALGLTGNKRIVSFDKTIENYVPAEEGRNYLIAVYEGDVDTTVEEYYNQNGQLIPGATNTTTVSMPGYGSTSNWVKYGTTNIWVADYGKTATQRDQVTVTAVDGTVNGSTEATVLFGDTVTCTADEANGTFKCWKKTKIHGATEAAPEIVSVEKNYTFNAWEDCTVTAVYAEHTPISTAMKIIIDDFTVDSETGIMAEFIGLDKAVEKGIMFGDKKIAMTTTGNQFTVIADKEGTYKGYAIVGNATDGYTLITDGSYTKSAN